MKKKVLAVLLSAAMAATMLAGCGKKAEEPATAPAETEAPAETPAEEPAEAPEEVAGDFADKKVGVCIYQFSDNFMTLFRTELENYLISLGFAKENITIVDGQNDQATQSDQIDRFIQQGVDVLIINPVNSSSAETITDKVVAANIPLVYINREPDEAEQKRWADNDWNVTYVGCDARQSGTMQGELIADLGLETIDKNGNGKIDYIMIQGDPENVDAQYRTEFSVKALTDAGMEVEELDLQRGDWDRNKGQEIAQNDLAKFGDEIEVVFCNNDDMAIGALQAIQAAGRKVNEDIYLVGVDALDAALNEVANGNMTGTVLNDAQGQAQGAVDAMEALLGGATYASGEQSIYVDYVKVTPENVADFQ